MNLFFPHGNRVLQSPMHALAAEQSDAEAEERAGLRPWRMGAVGCMAAKAPGRARRKGSNGRDGLASCMARLHGGTAKAARAEARRTMRLFNCSYAIEPAIGSTAALASIARATLADRWPDPDTRSR